MLPIVWFAIAVVSSLWILLLYTELRNQVRRHVKGCPSLRHISPERLNSLVIIDLPSLSSSAPGSCLRTGLPH